MIRRNLLARIALYTEPSTQENRLAYARALRHRQLLLERHPPDAKSLITFESLIAEHGFELARCNARAAVRVREALTAVFGELSADLTLEAQFEGTEVSDTESYRRRLHDNRAIDKQRGRATFGPHRDDLRLILNGMAARQHASQGQQRLLALATKLAELWCIRAARHVHPVLLLDDIVSELDRLRTLNVFEWLKRTASQIFITAPRDDVVKSHDLSERDQRFFVAQNGQLHTA
jgi:DNA replication and repair protein RecF